MKRIRSTLVIFCFAIFICGAVNISQNTTDETTFPSLLSETWHITPSKSSNQIVTRIQFNGHVALYHDNIIEDYIDGSKNYYNAHEWPFSELSTAWKYVKDTYGPIGEDPHLFLFLHGNTSPNSRDTECSSQSFLDPNGGSRNLIDCHFPTHQFKNGFVETFQNFATIFSQIGNIIRYGAKGKFNDADEKICGKAMSDILFYDIYRHLNSKSQADVASFKKEIRRYDGQQNCFDAWFIPIYEKYHGAAVLNRYFELTKKYWPTTGPNGRCNTQMNVGDFIHFWSGAAGEDLQLLAAETKAFQGAVYQKADLEKARDKYQLKYPYNYTGSTGSVSMDVMSVMSPGGYTVTTINHTVNNEKPVSTEKNSEFKGAELPLAIVCVCIVLVMVVLMFMVLSVRNKSKLKKLEKKYRDLTLKDVNAFRMGVMHMNLGAGSHLSILSMPFNMAFEVPAERIAIDKSQVLGQGEFGIVYLGVLKGENGRPDVKVAVKKTKLGTQLSHFKALLSEIKIMAHLEKHENIAALLATVTLSISKCEVIAALEFCEKGDLLDNLRKCRRSFRNLWNQHYSKWTKTDYVEVNTTTQHSPCGLVLATEAENTQEISTLNLISWAGQIANGMLFLSSKDIIHGDLAARNVLLTADNIPKICDFGLSRQLLKYSNYRKTSSTPMPWKWLAVEALTHRTFSIQSDVWSFGVTLWEIFTLGKEPYPGRNWDTNFVDALIDGDGLLGQPEFGNSEIHDLMMNCMQEDPKERFSFVRIKTELENIEASLET